MDSFRFDDDHFSSSKIGAAPILRDKIKWVIWLPMVLFTLDDKSKNVVVAILSLLLPLSLMLKAK